MTAFNIFSCIVRHQPFLLLFWGCPSLFLSCFSCLSILPLLLRVFVCLPMSPYFPVFRSPCPLLLSLPTLCLHVFFFLCILLVLAVSFLLFCSRFHMSFIYNYFLFVSVLETSLSIQPFSSSYSIKRTVTVLCLSIPFLIWALSNTNSVQRHYICIVSITSSSCVKLSVLGKFLEQFM